ncbi:transmembrane protein, putative (macronuclear) [Tetrahymena thermophila SB210]|uniref:Transmembrane protein, putative n=1 Tax=Tetrahymena thermophila (strain SB210) TaxID=312017 RepID=W7XIS4_TETTS|nr:transmembrane protein, putative [Tetrahymena thermophila SB210]EWS74866.1 transmembrane protein, putative [Tetrahymena thermophila SB210]|eukprot:XP_012652579.1 transmembrane protein, putative [Tetrahymena thermophila SB210]
MTDTYLCSLLQIIQLFFKLISCFYKSYFWLILLHLLTTRMINHFQFIIRTMYQIFFSRQIDIQKQLFICLLFSFISITIQAGTKFKCQFSGVSSLEFFCQILYSQFIQTQEFNQCAEKQRESERSNCKDQIQVNL